MSVTVGKDVLRKVTGGALSWLKKLQHRASRVCVIRESTNDFAKVEEVFFLSVSFSSSNKEIRKACSLERLLEGSFRFNMLTQFEHNQ